MSEKNKPAHTVRGTPGTGLKLSIWENKTDDGRVWHSATLTRSYKDADQWKETHSLSQQDFLEVSEMFREAHAWVKEQARARSPQDGSAAEPGGYAEAETGRKRAGVRGA
jgi:hypothetical protein